MLNKFWILWCGYRHFYYMHYMYFYLVFYNEKRNRHLFANNCRLYYWFI